MITGIIIIVLIVLGKFIYDSYLTNNTEKRWQEFKKSDSKTATKIEDDRFGIKDAKASKHKDYMPTNSNIKADRLISKNHLFDKELDLDSLLEYNFSDLYKLFYNKSQFIITYGLSEKLRNELEVIQDALDYHISFYQSILSELEEAMLENPKDRLEVFSKKSSKELKELIEYDFNFDVVNSLISNKINSLIDKFHSLEMLLKLDEDRPF